MCEHCDGSLLFTDMKENPNASAVVFLDRFAPNFKVRLYDGTGKWIQATINYCPWCGRNLRSINDR